MDAPAMFIAPFIPYKPLTPVPPIAGVTFISRKVAHPEWAYGVALPLRIKWNVSMGHLCHISSV